MQRRIWCQAFFISPTGSCCAAALSCPPRRADASRRRFCPLYHVILPTEAGNYYLTADVTLSRTWTVSANIKLCLNGKTSPARRTRTLSSSAAAAVTSPSPTARRRSAKSPAAATALYATVTPAAVPASLRSGMARSPATMATAVYTMTAASPCTAAAAILPYGWRYWSSAVAQSRRQRLREGGRSTTGNEANRAERHDRRHDGEIRGMIKCQCGTPFPDIPISRTGQQVKAACCPVPSARLVRELRYQPSAA